ncbi:unnamed protein product [Tilletia controversa]|uniref:Transmembrane protein n=1 Tax=Tilletia controversa TaxID=13291 RepID=A0A8X7SU59_9BASI|nr:hypothetical protein CF328_g6494 [Tilletia controversa]KAE8241749.1 hypothetical protein A4X06_0g7415 [Tilletia controversa]CAD6902320.1 unnamed protein product [Tilletia controversa]CAD6931607.1 unnamed protein product [Tilletia controversa]CAD6967540.1 unnamed protein product [Tilletia controversa]
MVNWSDPLVMQQAYECAVALFWISVGLTIREQISTFSFDWNIITGHRQRRWPHTVYFLVKICWWAYVALNIVFMYTYKEIKCQQAMWSIEAMMGLITVLCSILLACRTVCVYQNTARKVIMVALSIFAMGLAAAWGQGVTSVGAVWVPGGGKPWNDGACAFAGVARSYSYKYIVTILFDLTVLMLTVYGVYRLEGSTTKIGHILIRQGIIYFILTCVVNALITGFTIAQLNPVMSLFLAVPVSAISMVASTRLYVELSEETRPSRDRRLTFSREKGGSDFGTASANTADSRKRNLKGLFGRMSSASRAGSEKAPHILPLNLIASSPLVGGVDGATLAQSADGQVYMVQSIPRNQFSDEQLRERAAAEDAIENVSTPVMSANATASEEMTGSAVRRSRPSIETVPACVSPSCVTPSCGSHMYRPHRKQPSYSVLPSAAAAAAGLRVQESHTVTSEPMPVHLLGFGSTTSSPSSSSTQDKAVAKEFPSLSKGNHGQDQ